MWKTRHWYTIAVLWVSIESKTLYKYETEAALFLSSALLKSFLTIPKYLHVSEISDV